MAKKIIYFGLIFALTLFLFWPSFSVYFTGDDFFHFKIAQTDGSILGFIKLFGFYSYEIKKAAFYRPLFREAIYNLSYSLWGLNQLPLRILSMLLHFANVILVFVVMKKIFKNELIAYLTSFFVAVSAANAALLYYIAGGLQSQAATLLILLTMILFPKHKTIAFITFVLSLMSHELAVITPVLLTGYTYLNKNFRLKQILPYFAVSILYLYADFKIIGFSKSEVQYGLVLNPKTTINSLFWYSLWSFGLPETLIDFVNPGFKLNPNLMKYWGDLYKFIFPSFFVLLGSFFAAALLRFKRINEGRELLFLGFWFIVGISTVLFLPMHKSTYYLALSLPAFWGIVSYFLIEKKILSKASCLIFIISFSVFTYYSIKVMDTTYWVAQRGRLSERLLKDFKSQNPTLPKAAVILVKNDPGYPFVAEDWGGTSKQASLILSGADAFQLLYRDPDLKVYYQDSGGLPPETEGVKVFEFTAKIN